MPTFPKPILPPFWKWLMRVTFVVTMALFLAPAVYMVKYYSVDKPREREIVKQGLGENAYSRVQDADVLPLLEYRARSGTQAGRLQAVQNLGETLLQPYISVKRPLECLSAKATLADLATKDKDPAVRAAASEALGKVAQSGAIIRRE